VNTTVDPSGFTEDALGIKIVIVDDQKIGREGLRSLFTTEPEMEIVGEAEDGRAAVQLAQHLAPHVVLMGIGTCGMELLEATRQMLELSPALRIIGLSHVVDAAMVREFLATGAAGFITKSNGFSDFLIAIRAVMSRRIYLSPDVAQAMVDQYVLRPPGDRAGTANGQLTLREREVLRRVADGMSTKETAAALKISTKTVDMHRQHIMNKLKLRSVAELTKYAIRQGITALHQ
jgi:DNA-binding NarL/FixJ family response regulator